MRRRQNGSSGLTTAERFSSIGVCWQDVFEKLPEGGDVPLPVSEIEDILSYSLVGCYPECITEAPVDRKYPQVSIKHHKGFTYGLDYRLGISMVFLKCYLGLLTLKFYLFQFSERAAASLSVRL